MSRGKKTDRDKVLDQIRFLADEVGKSNFLKLKENGVELNGDDIEYGPHTLLKLAYFNYYLGFFTRIANSRKSGGLFDKILFVDAFGGSGLVKVKGTKYSVLGSSALAALNPQFDRIISLEIDRTKADMLQKRLNTIAPGKCVVYRGDVNILLKSMVNKEITDRTLTIRH